MKNMGLENNSMNFTNQKDFSAHLNEK